MLRNYPRWIILSAMDNSLVFTEQRNSASYQIDAKSTMEILQIMNNQDKNVPLAVETALPQIATVVEDVVNAFRNNGRLFYIGAGTSGRLGVLDASECPPTFGVDYTMVQGIIAGGQTALTRSVEWAEDDGEAAIQVLKEANFSSRDVLIGITASGGAAFVVDAMKHALSLGAKVGAICCNPSTLVFDIIDSDHRIYLPVGPEIITGSTRLKSGTAQKLVLNMISTTAMIRIGKVYNNLMVDLRPVNHKLIQRAIRLIQEVTGCSSEVAKMQFEASNHNTKVAIVMELLGESRQMASDLLERNQGSISRIIKEKKK
jgi:N-acetylmuramic acid 6-phosphate etherase